MEKVISKERFVNGFMSLVTFNADELTNLKFNNDIVFYKRLLDKGITRFEGGAREGFELTYDIHMELYEESKVRTLTDQEEKMLDTFFDTINQMGWIFKEADDETGD